MFEVILLLSLGALGISLVGGGDGGGDDSDDPLGQPAVGTLGDGDDDAALTENADTVEGGLGDDIIDALGGDDWLRGNDGNDTLFGGTGSDFLAGNAGDDSLDGQDGDDTLRGGVRDDLIEGGPGDDVLESGTGSDRLWGGDGDDILVLTDEIVERLPYEEAYGGAGNDLIIVGNTAGLVSGDEGNDTISIDLERSDAYIDALGGEGDDLIVASRSGAGGTIYASGGEGNDTIDAGPGSFVSGDAGDDLILAEGIEIYGGAGNDLFVGDMTSERSLSGVVLDFTPGEDLILFDVPEEDAEEAELTIGDPVFDAFYGVELTEVALSAGGQTYSIFVQSAAGIDPSDIAVQFS